MGWSQQLEKLTTKGGHDLGELMKAVKIEMFSGIVSDTRVDTGRLRANWQIQENSPSSGTLDRIDKSGSIVNSEILSKATENGTTYFVNNLPYAVVYEEKDAMVRRNIARVKQNIKNMARKIKG